MTESPTEVEATKNSPMDIDEDALETGKRKEIKKCNRGPNAMKLVFLLCACFLTLYFFLF